MIAGHSFSPSVSSSRLPPFIFFVFLTFSFIQAPVARLEQLFSSTGATSHSAPLVLQQVCFPFFLSSFIPLPVRNPSHHQPSRSQDALTDGFRNYHCHLKCSLADHTAHIKREVKSNDNADAGTNPQWPFPSRFLSLISFYPPLLLLLVRLGDTSRFAYNTCRTRSDLFDFFDFY